MHWVSSMFCIVSLQIGALRDYYLLVKKDHPSRSKRSADHHTRSLREDNRVRLIYEGLSTSADGMNTPVGNSRHRQSALDWKLRWMIRVLCYQRPLNSPKETLLDASFFHLAANGATSFMESYERERGSNLAPSNKSSISKFAAVNSHLLSQLCLSEPIRWVALRRRYFCCSNIKSIGHHCGVTHRKWRCSKGECAMDTNWMQPW